MQNRSTTSVFKKQPKKTVERLPVQQRAVALAARKLRSTAELRLKLIGEGYADGEVDAALQRLSEVYLIDDNLVAHSISRRYADRGNRFIAQKMKTKGIQADEHEAAFEGLPEEIDRAIALGEKKLKSLQNLERRVQAQKLYQHLALRGFSGAIIQKAVRRLTGTSEAD